jgi:hypothetical protein
LSAATAAKKRKDKQLDAISQEHQSTRERYHRLWTQFAEMGAKGIPYSKAWAFLNSKADFKTPGRSAEKIEEEITNATGDQAVVWLTKKGEEYLKEISART